MADQQVYSDMRNLMMVFPGREELDRWLVLAGNSSIAEKIRWVLGP